jgi:hypothetical protein
MYIQTTSTGWLIEPTNSDEARALEWLFEALKAAYTRAAQPTSSAPEYETATS